MHEMKYRYAPELIFNRMCVLDRLSYASGSRKWKEKYINGMFPYLLQRHTKQWRVAGTKLRLVVLTFDL